MDKNIKSEFVFGEDGDTAIRREYITMVRFDVVHKSIAQDDLYQVFAWAVNDTNSQGTRLISTENKSLARKLYKNLTGE